MGIVVNHPALNRPLDPVCSICIANYNGSGLLDDCLESVLAQQGNIRFEIIVHDDASADDSVTLLRDKYPQVELLASTDNVGFCISNNRMAEHARGEFILLLNNDAALYPDALVSLLDAAQAQLHPAILTLPQYDWESGTLVDRGCLLDPFYNPVPNLDPERADVAMVVGACLFVSRALWEELGGFPDWMESIGEDLYLCCQARLRGNRVTALTASGYRHRQGRTFGGNRPESGRLQSTVRRRRLSERNKTVAMLVLTPTLLVWPLLALHMLLLTLEGIAIGIVRWDWPIVREVYAGVFVALARHWRICRTTRRIVMSYRTIALHDYLRPFTLLPRKLTMLIRYGIPDVRR
jgi:GT2 family glycosyltransferase